MVRQNGFVVNKYFREFIVAVPKLTKQYAVMLINIITNLPTVMANGNNQTKQELQLSSNDQLSTLEIAGIVIGIIVGIGSLAVAIYMCRKQTNPEPNPEQDRMMATNDRPRENIHMHDNIGGNVKTNFANAKFSDGGTFNLGDNYPQHEPIRE